MNIQQAQAIINQGQKILSDIERNAPKDKTTQIAYLHQNAERFAQANAMNFAAFQGIDQSANSTPDEIRNKLAQLYPATSDAQKHLQPILTTIFDKGGENPKLTILPLAIKSENTGLEKNFLFRLDSNKQNKSQEHYVDDLGNYYASLKEWQTSNRLSPGEVIYPKDGKLSLNSKNQVFLETANTPQLEQIKKQLALLKTVSNTIETINSNVPQGRCQEEEQNKQNQLRQDERAKKIQAFRDAHHGARPNLAETINIEKLLPSAIVKDDPKNPFIYKTIDEKNKAKAAYLYKHADNYAHANARLALLTTGDDASSLKGGVLGNKIGEALQLMPDKGRSAGGDDSILRFSGKKLEAINQVQASIEKLGGVPAKVAILPLTVKDPEIGLIPFQLFRVETKQGDKFVDHVGRTYENFKDWRENNQLPPGEVFYPKNGHLTKNEKGLPDLMKADTPNNSTWNRHIKPYVDYCVIGAGLVIGGAAIFATGGVATPWVLWGGAALAGYGAASSGAVLYDMHQHGQSINPIESAQARANWLGVAGGATGLTAVATSLRFAQVAGKAMLVNEGNLTSSSASNIVTSSSKLTSSAKTAHVANVVDQYTATAGITDGSIGLAKHYKEMTPAERAVSGGLGVAIPSALFAVGVRQSGGIKASFNPVHLPDSYGVATQIETHVADRKLANQPRNTQPSILQSNQETPGMPHANNSPHKVLHGQVEHTVISPPLTQQQPLQPTDMLNQINQLQAGNVPDAQHNTHQKK